MLFALTARADLQLSLLTTTPGDQPHTLFGHSAIRVVDEENDFDKLYNFGLFDFKTPYFPIKFLRGNLKYWLGRQTIEGFTEINNKEQRVIKEQVLDLPSETKTAIFEGLKARHTPENKYYRYSFIHKNCATEIRDLFYKYEVLSKEAQLDKTYRELIGGYTTNHPWFGFGINLIMGSSVDQKATYTGAMFLPAYLEKAVAEKEGLVSENNVLNDPEPIQYNKLLIHAFSPTVIFTLLLIVSLFWSPAWFRKVIYGIVGLLGVFLVVLWLTTLHPELTNNWNVLWVNPLLIGLLVVRKQSPTHHVIVYVLLFSMLISLLVWLFGIQQFDWAALPLIALLGWFLIKELR